MFKWFGISLGAILLLGFLFVYFLWLAKPNSVKSFDQIDDEQWHTVNLGGESMCSDESEYFIFTRKGKSNNVIIHFSGGGACWDDNSCTKPITIYKALTEADSKDLKAFYYPVILDFFNKFLNGIFDNKNKENPFKDWNVVFLPYCTGDLHVGNIAVNYKNNGEEMKVNHNGQNNTKAALKWIFANFKNPEKIMVSGESAGGFASAYWAPLVAENYNDHNKIYQLSDCSEIFSERWPTILDSVWNMDSAKKFNFKIKDDAYTDALLNRTDSINKRIKHLNSNTMFDIILPRFYASLNSKSTKNKDYIYHWSKYMRESMLQLSKANIDYEYFLTQCRYDSLKTSTPHTLIGSDSGLYQCDSNGISYIDWLSKNVIEDESLSLGVELLTKVSK